MEWSTESIEKVICFIQERPFLFHVSSAELAAERAWTCTKILCKKLAQETCASFLCKFLDCVSPPLVWKMGHLTYRWTYSMYGWQRIDVQPRTRSWFGRWSRDVLAVTSPSSGPANAPVPREAPCGWCTHTLLSPLSTPAINNYISQQLSK